MRCLSCDSSRKDISVKKKAKTTRDNVNDGAILCVFAARMSSVSHPEVFILLYLVFHPPCHYLFFPTRQIEPPRAQRRIAAVRLRAEIFVTQSPVSLCASLSLSSPSTSSLILSFTYGFFLMLKKHKKSSPKVLSCQEMDFKCKIPPRKQQNVFGKRRISYTHSISARLP